MVLVEMYFWPTVLTLLGLHLVLGLALTCVFPRFRREGKSLLGLLIAAVGIPAVIYGIAGLGYRMHPPAPSSDALGPCPEWHVIGALPISLILLFVGASIMLKVLCQSALLGVRRLEHKEEGDQPPGPAQ